MSNQELNKIIQLARAYRYLVEAGVSPAIIDGGPNRTELCDGLIKMADLVEVLVKTDPTDPTHARVLLELSEIVRG